MTIERGLRLAAGLVVLLSLSLGYFVNPAWLLLTAFAGLNLLQSAFTNWCPMAWVFAGLGFQPCAAGQARYVAQPAIESRKKNVA
ncbi:MAG: DUF2892 domain-containing protein [Thermoguttaceae bacterium]|jgi:EamA domain-containing membrane protein RarD